MPSDLSPFALVATIVAVGAALLFLLRSKQRAYKNLPPGKLAFLIGGIEYLKEGFLDICNFPGEGPRKTRFLFSPTVLVRNFEQIKSILTGEEDTVTVAWPAATVAMLGTDSVTFSTGAYHRSLRRLLGPCFAPQAIEGYLPAIQSVCERYCAEWATATAAAAAASAATATAGAATAASGIGSAAFVERLPKMQKGARMLTFEVISHVVAGFNLSPQQLRAVSDAFDVLSRGIFAPFAVPIPGSNYAKAVAARKVVVASLSHQLEQLGETDSSSGGSSGSDKTKAGKEASGGGANGAATRTSSSGAGGGGSGGADGRSIMARLLDMTDEHGKPLTHKALMDLAINLLFAGHETTATSIVRLMLVLRSRPDVVERLRQEQAAAVRTHGTAITGSALRDMPYLDAVVKEVWRLHPVVPMVPRKAIRDFSLGPGGYDVPRGWSVVLGLVEPMRDLPAWSGLGPDSPLHPSHFNPDRWTANGSGSISANAFSSALQQQDAAAAAATAADSDDVASAAAAAGTAGGAGAAGSGTLSSPLGMLPPQMLTFGGGGRYCLGANLAWAELKVFMAVLLRGYDFASPLQQLDVKVFPALTITQGFPIEILLDAWQLFTTILDPQMGWAINSDSLGWKVLSVLSFGWLADLGYAWYLGVLYTMAGLLVINLALCVWVAWSFKEQKFDYVWPIKVVRTFSYVFLQVFDIASLNFLQLGISCNYMGPTAPRLHMALFPEYSCSEMPQIVQVIVSGILLLVFICVAMLLNMSEVEVNPTSKSPQALGHSGAEVRAFAIKALMTLVGVFLGYPKLAAAAYLVLAAWLAWQYLRWVPHLVEWVNYLKGGVAVAMLGVAGLQVGVVATTNTEVRQALTTAMAISLGPLFLLGAAATWARTRYLTRAVLRAFETWDPEVLEPRDVYHFSDPKDVEVAARSARKWADLYTLDKAAVRRAEEIIKAGAALFPDSAYVALLHANFMLDALGFSQTGAKQLEVARKMSPGLMCRFMLFVRQQQATQKAASSTVGKGGSMDLLGYVEYQRKQRMVLRHHKDALQAMANFWRILGSNSVSFPSLSKSLEEIDSSVSQAETAYRVVLELYNNSPRLVRLYARFLETIKQDPWGAAEYNAAAEHLEQNKDEEGQGPTLPDGTPMSRMDDVEKGVLVVNAFGDIQVANKKLYSMFGYRKGELDGKNVCAIMPPHEAKRHPAILRRYIDSGEKALPYFKCGGRGARRAGGGLLGSMGEDSVFIGLLEPVPTETGSGRVWVTAEGIIVCCDPGFVTCFGYRPDDVIGSQLEALIRSGVMSVGGVSAGFGAGGDGNRCPVVHGGQGGGGGGGDNTGSGEEDPNEMAGAFMNQSGRLGGGGGGGRRRSLDVWAASKANQDNHELVQRMLATASGPHGAAAAATGCSHADGVAGIMDDPAGARKSRETADGRASHVAAAAEKDGAARRASVDMSTQHKRTSALPPVVTYARVRHKYDFAKDCSVQVFNDKTKSSIYEVQIKLLSDEPQLLMVVERKGVIRHMSGDLAKVLGVSQSAAGGSGGGGGKGDKGAGGGASTVGGGGSFRQQTQADDQVMLELTSEAPQRSLEEFLPAPWKYMHQKWLKHATTPSASILSGAWGCRFTTADAGSSSSAGATAASSSAAAGGYRGSILSSSGAAPGGCPAGGGGGPLQASSSRNAALGPTMKLVGTHGRPVFVHVGVVSREAAGGGDALHVVRMSRHVWSSLETAMAERRVRMRLSEKGQVLALVDSEGREVMVADDEDDEGEAGVALGVWRTNTGGGGGAAKQPRRRRGAEAAWSSAVTDLFGFPSEQLLGCRIWDFLSLPSARASLGASAGPAAAVAGGATSFRGAAEGRGGVNHHTAAAAAATSSLPDRELLAEASEVMSTGGGGGGGGARGFGCGTGAGALSFRESRKGGAAGPGVGDAGGHVSSAAAAGPSSRFTLPLDSGAGSGGELEGGGGGGGGGGATELNLRSFDTMITSAMQTPGISWRCNIVPPSAAGEAAAMGNPARAAALLMRRTKQAVLRLDVALPPPGLATGELVIHAEVWAAKAVTGVLELDGQARVASVSEEDLRPAGLLFGLPREELIGASLAQLVRLGPGQSAPGLLTESGVVKKSNLKVGPVHRLEGFHRDNKPMGLAVQVVGKPGPGNPLTVVLRLLPGPPTVARAPPPQAAGSAAAAAPLPRVSMANSNIAGAPGEGRTKSRIGLLEEAAANVRSGGEGGAGGDLALGGVGGESARVRAALSKPLREEEEEDDGEDDGDEDKDGEGSRGAKGGRDAKAGFNRKFSALVLKGALDRGPASVSLRVRTPDKDGGGVAALSAGQQQMLQAAPPELGVLSQPRVAAGGGGLPGSNSLGASVTCVISATARTSPPAGGGRPGAAKGHHAGASRNVLIPGATGAEEEERGEGRASGNGSGSGGSSSAPPKPESPPTAGHSRLAAASAVVRSPRAGAALDAGGAARAGGRAAGEGGSGEKGSGEDVPPGEKLEAASVSSEEEHTHDADPAKAQQRGLEAINKWVVTNGEFYQNKTQSVAGTSHAGDGDEEDDDVDGATSFATTSRANSHNLDGVGSPLRKGFVEAAAAAAAAEEQGGAMGGGVRYPPGEETAAPVVVADDQRSEGGDSAMSGMSGISGVSDANTPADFKRGKRYRKLVKLMDSPQAQSAVNTFKTYSGLTVAIAGAIHVVCFALIITAIQKQEHAMNDMHDAGESQRFLQRALVSVRALDNAYKGLGNNLTYNASHVGYFANDIISYATQYRDANSHVLMGSTNKDTEQLYYNKEVPVWYGMDPATALWYQQNMTLWDLVTRFYTSAKDIFQNHVQWNATGVVDIANSEPGAFLLRSAQEVVLAMREVLDALLGDAVYHTNLVNLLQLLFLLIEGCLVSSCVAIALMYLLRMACDQRYKLYETFLTIPVGLTRALASQTTHLLDDDESDDELDDETGSHHEGEEGGNSSTVVGGGEKGGGGKAAGGGKRKAAFDAPDSDKAGNSKGGGGKGSVDMPLPPSHTKVQAIGGGGHGGRRASLDMGDDGGGGGGIRSKVAGEGGSRKKSGWMPSNMTGPGGAGVAAPVYPAAGGGSGDDGGGGADAHKMGLLARISSKLWHPNAVHPAATTATGGSGAAVALAAANAPPRRALKRNSRVIYGMWAIVLTYSFLIILFYSISYGLLLSVQSLVAMQAVSDHAVERTYRAVFYTQELVSETNPVLVPGRAGHLENATAALKDAYYTLRMGNQAYKVLGAAAEQFPKVAGGGLSKENAAMFELFYKDGNCLRLPEHQPCPDASWRYFQVTRTGVDGMMTRLLKELSWLAAESRVAAPAANLTSPRWDFIYNVGTMDLTDGLMQVEEAHLRDVERVMGLLVVLHVVLFLLLLGVFGCFLLLLFLPLLSRMNKEKRRIAEMMSQLPNELDVMRLVSHALMGAPAATDKNAAGGAAGRKGHRRSIEVPRRGAAEAARLAAAAAAAAAGGAVAGASPNTSGVNVPPVAGDGTASAEAAGSKAYNSWKEILNRATSVNAAANAGNSSGQVPMSTPSRRLSGKFAYGQT
ncbi:hypothetical protein HYH02_006619 [Chlamydomonas schloesseri]|uniref:PAS domain-containing protein n=1 Tax=Chlamydomonas schloesseri TaxID=2026947 RepID=A0A835THZ8_9CHLO|nr:hypothetical protein HYH02_006619 [Chlamydomonas schloesseri]|eukprot:KAG2439095.1 hypothetical protein HYH02_006619 [Chlamydomonas schloesseri]